MLSRAVLMITSISIFGCAYNTVYVTTEPAGAQVSVIRLNGTELSLGVSPAKFRLRSDRGWMFVARKEGKESTSYLNRDQMDWPFSKLFGRREAFVKIVLEKHSSGPSFSYLRNEDIQRLDASGQCRRDYLKAFGVADVECRKQAYLGSGEGESEARGQGDARSRSAGTVFDHAFWNSCMLAKGWILTRTTEAPCLDSGDKKNVEHP